MAPISQSKAHEVLDKDLFTFLNITDVRGGIYYHPWLVLLNEQRRMHPDISRFPNEVIYHGLLKDHPDVKNSHTRIVANPPFAGSALTLMDLTGTFCAAGKNSDNSRYNILSAITSFAAAVTAEKSGEDSIGIISPYAAQTRLIRALVQDYRKNNQTNITCSTVHQFQGSERNIIIFDAVECYPSKQVGWLMSKNENNALTRLINVAITRAKGKLIVIAHRGFWLKMFDGSHNALFLLIKHIQKKATSVSTDENGINQFYQSVDVGKGISVYTDASSCTETLISDIKKAKRKILVSLPNSKIIPQYADQVWTSISEVSKQGVLLQIKAIADTYLPSRWKSCTAISDKAVFPLIIIDDKTLWYGYPLTVEEFKDGRSGYETVVHAIVRLTGENTIEMIKSLSEIEDSRRSTDSVVDLSITSGGFTKFIEQKEFCAKCKSYFKILRNPKTGKYYLRCSNSKCASTKPLDYQLVRWYINQHNIRCPKHKCALTFHSGNYGPYLHCDHGHNLKLTDI